MIRRPRRPAPPPRRELLPLLPAPRGQPSRFRSARPSHRPLATQHVGLRARLAAFGRARAAQCALLYAARALAVALALDLLLLGASRLLAIALPLWWLAPPPLLALAAGALVGRLRPVPAGWVAAELDRRLALRERAITALELTAVVPTAPRHPLAAAQLADTAEQLRRVEPAEAFPLALPRREAVLAAALAVALVGALALVPPARLATPTDGLLERVADAEAERLSALVEVIAREEAPDAEEARRAELAELLREASEALRDRSLSPAQTMAKLSELERKLASRQGPSALDVAQALSRLADSLDQSVATRGVTAALDRRDYPRAAEELRRLGQEAAGGADQQRQALAEALRQAARATNRHDQALADALRQAAEQTAANQGASPTEDAAEELERAGSQAATDEALQRALSELQQARRSLGDAASGQPGQPSGAGERGQQGMSGGQPGAGEMPGGGVGTGSTGRTGDNRNPNAMRSRQVQVPTGQFDNPSIGESDQVADGEDGEVTVDYREVLPVYRERATRAMQDRYVPHALKDLVRDYFSSLQPTP